MENIQKFSVVELNQEEMTSTSGGFIGCIIAALVGLGMGYLLGWRIS